MVPLALVRDVEITPLEHLETLPFCTERWVYVEKPVYMTCLMVFVYVIPGGVITISYSFIGCQLIMTDEGLHRIDSRAVQDQTRALMQSRRKVARMLMCLAILFAFCWMPYNICSLYIDLRDEMDVVSLTALPFTLCLGHSNSALNPVLYWFMNKSFRKAVRRKFGCRRRRSGKSFKSPTPVSEIHEYGRYAPFTLLVIMLMVQRELSILLDDTCYPGKKTERGSRLEPINGKPSGASR
jgi:hypothetical protein